MSYGEGNIYKSKVRIENIIDYLDMPGEEEVLIQPKDIEQVEII